MAAALLLAGLLPSRAAAQEPPKVQEGMRIRVSAPVYHQGLRVKGTSRWIVGDVREVTPTSVVLQTDPADSASRTEIPFDIMRGAEVSHGVTDVKSSVRRSAVRGALAGAGTSVFFYGLLSLLPEGGPRDPDEEIINTSPEIIARNTAVTAAAGAAIGALIGTRQREKWGRLGIPRVRMGPAWRPVSLSLSIDL